MLVLKLCKQFCPEKIPVIPATKLGDGADGEVFEIKDQSDLVIKFCVLYETGPVRVQRSFKNVKKVLEYLQANPLPIYARVISFGMLGQFERETARKKPQPFILYYYIMEKLQKITEDERKVFHSIISHEDRGIIKNYPASKIQEMLEGMRTGLDFDMERVTFFCNKLRNVSVVHRDIHVRNIMKDCTGNFKLIDFDRAQLMENGNAKK